MNQREYRRMFEVEDRHWWYVGLHELIVTTIGRLASSAKEPLHILDVGCGTGRLMQILSSLGTVEGCDISPEAVACCRQRALAGVRVADLNTLSFPEQSCDVITAIDVLYHRRIRDENAVLRSLCRALKPGGILIRNDPAFEVLHSAHDAAVHTRERYRREVVRARLIRAGLTPEVVTYRLAVLTPLIAIYRLARRWGQAPEEEVIISDVGLPRPWVNHVLLRIVRNENRILSRVSLPFGTSVFAVARRPAGQERELRHE